MKELLKDLCDKYLLNLGLFTDLCPLERDILYPVCASIFCTADAEFDLGKFKESLSLIKENPRMLSSFRSTMRPLIASLLSVSDDPRGRIAQYLGCCDIMKKYFTNSERLALLAFLLIRFVSAEKMESYIRRGRQIYDRMKKEHRILTTNEDVTFAVMLAFSKKTDDQLIEDMEKSYKLLKHSAEKNIIQSVSHVLAVDDSSPEEKCGKFLELYGNLLKKGKKYGKHYELAMLAALSVADRDSSEIIGDLGDIDAFLAQHKAVFDLSGFGTDEPVCHSFMLLSAAYARAETDRGESAKTAVIAAGQAALYSFMMYSMMTVAPVVPD